MEFVPILLGLAGMHLLMAMSPGPNILTIGWLSATRSRRDGLLAASGVVIASLGWVGLALWGAETLPLDRGWPHNLLLLLGTAYLIWIGLRMLNSAFSTRVIATPQGSGRHPFMIGLLGALCNPRAGLFWISAFQAALPDSAPHWLPLAIILVIAVQATLWYSSIAMLFSTCFARAQYLRLSRVIDLAAGAGMLVLGLKLADDLRHSLIGLG